MTENPLVTVDDVAARLGRPVSDEEKPQFEAFIEDVIGLIEDYCQADFRFHENEMVSIPLALSIQLELPRRMFPLAGISSVLLDGQEVTDYLLKGGSLWRRGGWIPRPFHGIGSSTSDVQVTASWGYRTCPAGLMAIVCAEVIRWAALRPGVSMERVGELETSFGSTPGQASLSEATLKALRRRYRRGSFRTVTMRKEDTDAVLQAHHLGSSRWSH
ncbi:phage gp6-like head-tail connector protein [Streptomyces sp. CBMA123]|uniref:phage gp6-like head-tail connector protein n=1 Tax=Streptomyces sp. CBMA123 TaxID=1896313 RepID=UPI00166212CE|nr:phage gp6-like head-tail connector protein [Streptomyces sp. CBMA123]MBD0689660.1 hypothetical protein [Streptomyces sp. CBMA123]